MPRIKPFRGIRPNPEYVDRVVLPLENLSISQAKEILESNPFSYANMLVPKLENRFLMGSKKELAYKQINENFEEFLDKQIYLKDLEPSIYVYRIQHRGITQTGIWTVTAIDDYLNNTVKKHELTLAEREAGLIDYLQQTGIDANPVLITYPADQQINLILDRITFEKADLSFEVQGQQHWLWRVKDAETVTKLIESFAKLPASYIADGHHRAAAACTAGIERRKLNLKHRGNEEYNFFTSVYMASDQLLILEFNRLVQDLNGYSIAAFLVKLNPDFEVVLSDERVKPQKKHQFGMYVEGQWYQLTAKPHTFQVQNPAQKLDVSILQRCVLASLLAIEDPRTDARISFTGGLTQVEELERLVNEGKHKVLFTLHPTSIEELIQVADAGEVMPPKSTWFEPKFLAGLLIHQID